MDKILVLDKLAKEGVKILQKDFEVDCIDKITPEELKKIVSKYAAVIVRSQTQLDKDIIEKATSAKVMGRAGVGVDNIDVEAATRKGIIVMNAPGGNTISTCEHTFGMMLALSRNIPQAHGVLSGGVWEKSKFKGVELHNKNLGIIGLGRIGSEVAKRARAFGMNVYAYDPYISEEKAKTLGVAKASLDGIIKNCDYITVHLPLTEETKDLISEEELSAMKPTAFLINCARGGVVNEAALANALKEKKIKGAALDVFEKEPPAADNPLLKLDNIVVTPHLGASTDEAQVSVAIEMAECVRDVLQGRGMKNVINFSSFDSETYKKLEPYNNLCETMGRFLSQIIEGGIQKVSLTYSGELSGAKTDLLTASFLKGMLGIALGEDVNFINSPSLARERGIAVEEVKSSERKAFLNAIEATIATDKEVKSLEGTLFGNREPRIVRVDDFYFEVAPTKHMIFASNKDMPGVVGKLGTVLGNHQINIAGMSLGRTRKGGAALTILNVDSAVPAPVIKTIMSDERMIFAKPVSLQNL